MKNSRGFERSSEIYHGKLALLLTWEMQPKEVQANERAMIKELRRKVYSARQRLVNATRNSPLKSDKSESEDYEHC